MIAKYSNGEWGGVTPQPYKDRPGSWQGVSRHKLVAGLGVAFEMRYFEIEPNGYTSFERHEHQHAVLVLNGIGRVRLGDEWTDVAPPDVVHIESNVPHQFQNTGPEPLGIVCVVDRERDRPVLLDPSGEAYAAI